MKKTKSKEKPVELDREHKLAALKKEADLALLTFLVAHRTRDKLLAMLEQSERGFQEASEHFRALRIRQIELEQGLEASEWKWGDSEKGGIKVDMFSIVTPKQK